MEQETIKERTERAEREVEHAQNILLHEAEIKSRPARTWYQSSAEKIQVKEAARAKAQFENEVAKVGAEVATAAQKAKEIALRDDYQLDQLEREKNKEHKMSRKKRRRLEALRAAESGPGIVILLY